MVRVQDILGWTTQVNWLVSGPWEQAEGLLSGRWTQQEEGEKKGQ